MFDEFEINSLWKFTEYEGILLVVDLIPNCQNSAAAATFFYLMRDLTSWNMQTYTIESIYPHIEKIC